MPCWQCGWFCGAGGHGLCLFFVCQWYVSSLYFFFLVDFLTEYESVHPNLHCPRWSWQWEVCSGGEQLMTQQAHVSRCPCWFMFCVLIVDTHLLTCICLLTSIAFVDKHFDCWHAGSLVNLLLQVVLRLLQDTRCHLQVLKFAQSCSNFLKFAQICTWIR